MRTIYSFSNESPVHCSTPSGVNDPRANFPLCTAQREPHFPSNTHGRYWFLNDTHANIYIRLKFTGVISHRWCKNTFKVCIFYGAKTQSNTHTHTLVCVKVWSDWLASWYHPTRNWQNTMHRVRNGVLILFLCLFDFWMLWVVIVTPLAVWVL